MKIPSKLLALALSVALLCSLFPASAAEEKVWRRTEPGGKYVTVRVPCPEGQEMSWAQTQDLMVRYGDSKDCVPLTSVYYDGYLFATVPARDAWRPLESYSGTPTQFRDELRTHDGSDLYDPPMGTSELNLRGLLHGDGTGQLNADSTLSRAEAFALLTRLLSLRPGDDPDYLDVAPTDWFYSIASASRAAGIASQAEYFHPLETVTRGEMMVMLYRAMLTTGWVSVPEGTAADLPYLDADTLPDWAVNAYLALTAHNVTVCDWQQTGTTDEENLPISDPVASWDLPCTRGEMITAVYEALTRLPWYPRDLAIRWGLDREMPALDASSPDMLSCFQTLYCTLFYNETCHPLYPETEGSPSCERLLNGETDLLITSAEPSEEILRQAQEAGVELERIPIGHNALVFFTSADNPAEGLTSEQLRNIYVSNAVSNWNEVEGPDAHLVPYFRADSSDAQTLMEQFLQGAPIHPDIFQTITSDLAPILSLVPEDPDASEPEQPELSEQPGEPEESEAPEPPGKPEGSEEEQPEEPVLPTWALGYDAYYDYLAATSDGQEHALKLLKVDGVLPGPETIADGSYPLSSFHYAVIRSEASGSPARALADFLCSEEGQSCIASAGFGRLDGTGKPADPLPDPSV